MLVHLDEIPSLKFSGGEVHPDIAGTALENAAAHEPVTVRAVVRSADDLLNLSLVAEILRRRRSLSGRPAAKLILPYIPYARQDRATTPTTAHALSAFAKILNGLGFEKVTVYEPHSDIAPNLIQNCEVVGCERAAGEYVTQLIAGGRCSKVALVAPDAGASKRTERVLTHLLRLFKGRDVIHPKFVQAIKHRDPATGRLEMEYVSPIPPGVDVVVIDDICDGGATFLELAKFLGAAQSRHLFVAHGIFSKGVDKLLEAYQTIGTTDSLVPRSKAAEMKLPERVARYESI